MSKTGDNSISFSVQKAIHKAIAYSIDFTCVYLIVIVSIDFFRATHGKHLGPVWQIKWINKEKGSGEEIAEVLITISTDGRVSQWSIRKGFECYGKFMKEDLILLFYILV